MDVTFKLRNLESLKENERYEWSLPSASQATEQGEEWVWRHKWEVPTTKGPVT